MGTVDGVELMSCSGQNTGPDRVQISNCFMTDRIFPSPGAQAPYISVTLSSIFRRYAQLPQTPLTPHPPSISGIRHEGPSDDIEHT